MDDLLGEDWQAPAKPTSNVPSNPAVFASNYSSLRASPKPYASGTASPLNLSRPSSTVNGGPKSSGDTFGNLLSLKAQKAGSNLSIQERQKQLLEEKRKHQAQQAEQWESLGSGRGTPDIRGPSPAPPAAQDDEDDILAAFNKSAPVNKASHFPPPSSTGVSGTSTPALRQSSQPAPTSTQDEDDDPFGLGSGPAKSNGHVVTPATHSVADEDDILGDLGKPMIAREPRRPDLLPEPQAEEDSSEDETGRAPAPEDRALAELVEMGFPADTAKIALAENGGNVQGAVGWLLQQAHEESRQKARGEGQTRQRTPVHGERSPPTRQRSEQGGRPAWMREELGAASVPRRQDSRSPANGDKDASQMAQELGSKLFKGANSLWKASQKQMAKTMSDFQQERDGSQPRWMQDSGEASRDNSRPRQQPPKSAARKPIDSTDEAAMLDAPREARPSKPTRPSTAELAPESPARGRSPVESLPHRPSAQPKFVQQAPPQRDRRPASKLSRQQVEEQSAEAYVSPARRKRPTPKPEPLPEPEVDLFSPAPASAPPGAPPRQAQSAPPPKPSSTPVRPKAPPRNIPPVSPSALATSAQHRKAGGEAFKRGDFASAHESYTSALRPLPDTHPILIIVLSNRSLTALKTGDAKTAVSDADRALEIIGHSQGVGESIELGAGEGSKDMREFYGKALMRKAEALEHLEKWTEGAAVWRQAIAAGVGGAVSIRGRDRCEKAAAAKSAVSVPAARPAPRKPPPPAKSLGNSMQRPTLASASSAQAVKKLREANAAAEKADDEKFALNDQVDARLTAWKGGKADNLRALLQSLDTVLWEGAGWKKVGMSDLVMPSKVKIIYMKAIGKVHPDKVFLGDGLRPESLTANLRRYPKARRSSSGW